MLVASDSAAIEKARELAGCHAIWLDDAELFRENAARTLQQILGAKPAAGSQSARGASANDLGATAEIIKNSAEEVAGALRTIESKINELGSMLEAVGGDERAAAISIQAAQRHAVAMNRRILQAVGAEGESLDRIKFHDILRGAVRLLQQERSAGFSPELRYDAEKTEIEANPSQLSKALHSLLGAWASLYGGSRARMAIVTDNSAGSAAELRLRVAGRGVKATGPEFEPDADLSTVQGRLPVGPLERAIRASGGKITLRQGPKSEPVMAVAIPLAETPERDDSTAGLAMFQGSAQILLVDHERVARAMTEAMLTRLGYQVVIAPDGPDALSKIQDLPESFGAALAEMVLPGMDGARLLDEIKSIRPGIRCILCSANPEVIQANSGVNAPHDGFIEKPFKVRELGALLLRVLPSSASVK